MIDPQIKPILVAIINSLNAPTTDEQRAASVEAAKALARALKGDTE